MPPWFPSFPSAGLAALAGALAIPSLLLLYFLKLRRKEMAVSSTILWRKAIQDLQVNSPFQKLRKNMLLLLQMLLLMLLLLALANPTSFYRPRAGKNTVILIDRSGSMNARDADGKTRLDEAKRRANNLLDTLGKDSRAMVIAFDSSAETIAPFSGDVAGLKQAVNSIQPTDRSTRLKLAYQLADAQMNFDPAQLRSENQQKVYLYSDGRVLDPTDLALRGDVEFEPLGDANSKNIALVALSAKRNYEKPNEVQVFARLANYGPNVEAADVQLSISPIDPASPGTDAFAVRQVRTSTRIFPARWDDKKRTEAEGRGERQNDSVEFTLDLTTAAVIKVEQMNKDNDVLAGDDGAMVVVPPPKPLTVCLVTDGNYFVERIVRSLELQKPEVLTPGEWEQQKPTDFDVVIFDRYAPRYMPPGGNFVWLGALPANLQLKQSFDGAKRPLFLEDVEVLDWARDHPMLRYLSLSKLFVAEALKLEVPITAQTLIEGTKGPLLVLSREGRNVHLVVAFDVLQSNWPLRKSFPIFVYNALQYLAVGSDLSVRESLAPGATPKISAANLTRALGAGETSIKLYAPLGATTDLKVLPTGDFALPALDRVGLYRTVPSIPQYERFAVNMLDENESNLLPADHAPGDIGKAGLVANNRSSIELRWWLIAACALPLLLIEWWVYTRRVHA